MALWLLYGPQSSPWLSILSLALSHLYVVPSMVLCHLYDPLQNLRPSTPTSMALYLLYGPLPLNNHLYSLLPSVSSTSHLPL
jgi:hypothetical protein